MESAEDTKIYGNNNPRMMRKNAPTTNSDIIGGILLFTEFDLATILLSRVPSSPSPKHGYSYPTRVSTDISGLPTILIFTILPINLQIIF